MSTITIKSFFENSSQGVSNLNQTTNKPKNKKKPASIYKYLDTLEDSTCICKACNKVVGKWGSCISLTLIIHYFKQKHPSIFKEFQKLKSIHPSLYSVNDRDHVELLDCSLLEFI